MRQDVKAWAVFTSLLCLCTSALALNCLDKSADALHDFQQLHNCAIAPDTLPDVRACSGVGVALLLAGLALQLLLSVLGKEPLKASWSGESNCCSFFNA